MSKTDAINVCYSFLIAGTIAFFAEYLNTVTREGAVIIVSILFPVILLQFLTLEKIGYWKKD